jgi:hypothetical protein
MDSVCVVLSEGRLMATHRAHRTTSGGSFSAEFRDNIVIDRHDAILAGTRPSRLKNLRSADADDAVTWNTFRTLRQIDPTVWLPELFRFAFQNLSAPTAAHAIVSMWRIIESPPGLVLAGDEADAEIDVVLEAPTWVWFIEAKYRGDFASNSSGRPDRNEILRSLDVGSAFAGTRDFYFSLLAADRHRLPVGAALVDEYADLTRPRALLREHRPDGLANLRGVSLLTWSHLADVIADAADSSPHADERVYAERAVQWLERRGIVERVG